MNLSKVLLVAPGPTIVVVAEGATACGVDADRGRASWAASRAARWPPPERSAGGAVHGLGQGRVRRHADAHRGGVADLSLDLDDMAHCLVASFCAHDERAAGTRLRLVERPGRQGRRGLSVVCRVAGSH